jgi:hypothetical protein
MSVRVVPLHSPEASDAHVGGTAAERVALVVMLSESSWDRTGRSRPTYTRSTMPVAITTLRAQDLADLELLEEL